METYKSPWLSLREMFDSLGRVITNIHFEEGIYSTNAKTTKYLKAIVDYYYRANSSRMPYWTTVLANNEIYDEKLYEYLFHSKPDDLWVYCQDASKTSHSHLLIFKTIFIKREDKLIRYSLDGFPNDWIPHLKRIREAENVGASFYFRNDMKGYRSERRFIQR